MTQYLKKSTLKRCLIWLTFSLFHLFSFGQSLEGNNWYFGINAGLSFYPKGPSIDPQAKSNNPGETASISDRNGNLLFYVSGDKVFDSDHNIASNGSLSYSGKHLIVKKPGSNKTYYLFTAVSAQIPGNSLASILKLSQIDLLGPINNPSIVHQGVSLPYIIRSGGFCVLDKGIAKEKWLLLKSDTLDLFASIPIDSNGLQLHLINYQRAQSSFSGGIPNMKSSPDSRYFSVCSSQPENIVQVFRFDKTTGQVGSKIFEEKVLGQNEVYSASFSPNSRAIFISRRSRLMRYDLSSNDSLKIKNSMSILKQSSNPLDIIYDLQIAVDGNIYFVDGNINSQLSRKLSRIDCPNLAVDSSFLRDTILGPIGLSLGAQLPTLNQTLYVNTHRLQAQCTNSKDTLCPGDSAQLVAYGASLDQYFWSPSSGLSCTTCNAPKVAPSSTTTYRVIGHSSCSTNIKDTAFVTVYVVPDQKGAEIVGEKSFCSGDSIPLFVKVPYRRIVWGNGSVDDTLWAQNEGVYSTTIVTPCYTKSLNHTLVQLPDPTFALFPKDTIVCVGQKVKLRGVSNATIRWFNGSAGDYTFTEKEGIYYEFAENQCGIATDTAIIRHSKPLALFQLDSSVGEAPFSAKAMAPDTFASVKWILNGNELANSFELFLDALPVDTHTLQLVAKDQFGCFDTLSHFIHVRSPSHETSPSTVDSIQGHCLVSVYPNPFVNKFKLSSNPSNDTISEISLIDVKGQSIFQAKELVHGSPINVNDSHLATGVYFIRYRCNRSWHELKVVKSN